MTRLSRLLLVLLLQLALAYPNSNSASAQSGGWPQVALVRVTSGLDLPVAITHAGDGSGRLFVVGQRGVIRIVRDRTLVPQPLLDISGKVLCCGEQGLLGLAFPPNYGQKGHFYVNYTDGNGDTIVARYRITANPDVADAASEQIVLRVAQPAPNHNGGQLQFGPIDGYLYIGMGDGGGAGDPQGRAQNPMDLLGKLLRIDVETGNPATYTIPPTNPFAANSAYRPEIWALGLRNPWRFSFDRATRDLWMADVGQGSWEEIDLQAANSTGGQNYGWDIMEGAHCFDGTTTCNTTGLTPPIAEYDHSAGDCSITGGYAHRAPGATATAGMYIFGDYCSGRIWGLRQGTNGWERGIVAQAAAFAVASFGEDEAGSLYVTDRGAGSIYRLVDRSTLIHALRLPLIYR